MPTKTATRTNKAKFGQVILIDGKKYLVEEAKMEGDLLPAHDRFPDGWHVFARRLNNDGSYNPKGRKIDFFQSGSFSNMRPEVEVVGRMKVSFVPKG